MMKKLVLKMFVILILLSFNYGVVNGQSFQGATLLKVINTNLADSTFHFGMSYYDSALYLTSWSDNKLTKIDITTDSVAQGFPAALSNVSLPHGIVVDESDGSIWICDLNSSSIQHYSQSLNLIESKIVGSQPVNAIINQDTIYVADRNENKIFLLNKSTLNLIDSFSVIGMDSTAYDFVDLFIYSNKLYVVSNEINGIITMDLNGANQDSIIIKNEGYDENIWFVGIYIKNDKIYLNSYDRIYITDLQGNMVNYWNCENDKPTGFTGVYIDLEILNNSIYISSHNAGTGDTAVPHILVYEDIIMSIDESKISEIPVQFTLKQNYPNPFNPSTKITYILPRSSFISLTVYDVLGREIRTLVSEFQKANTYSIDFNASELSSGIYIYRLQVGNDFVETRKMLLLR